MLIVAFVFMLVSSAEPTKSLAKPPWRWTSAERIEQRVDPAARNARRIRELPSVRNVAPGWSPINGSAEPELLMPSELVRTLILSTDSQSPYGLERREHYRAAIQSAGWDYDDFWEILQSIGASYVALMRQSAELQRASRGRADLKAMQISVCGVLADTVLAAHTKFGAAAFDEFLYTTVAPAVRVWLDDREDTADVLRSAERGCK